MGPSAKKRKLEKSPTVKQLQFLDLNDDCILTVMEKLSSIGDLRSLSSTCHRLKDLASLQFWHENRNKFIAIIVRPDLSGARPEDFQVAFSKIGKDYLDWFGKKFRNIRLSDGGWDINPQRLIDFFKNECCDMQLKSLKLRISGHLDYAHGELIKDQLKNLNYLSILYPHVRSDVHSSLLKHCENLEHFAIETNNQSDTFWLLNEYPKLKLIS